MNNRKQPAFPVQELEPGYEGDGVRVGDVRRGFTKEEYFTLRIALVILGTTTPQYLQQVGGTDKVLHPNPRSVALMARKFAKELLDQLDLDGAEMAPPAQPGTQWQTLPDKGGIDLDNSN